VPVTSVHVEKYVTYETQTIKELNTTQKRKHSSTQSRLMTLGTWGNELKWAYCTVLPSPHRACYCCC